MMDPIKQFQEVVAETARAIERRPLGTLAPPLVDDDGRAAIGQLEDELLAWLEPVPMVGCDGDDPECIYLVANRFTLLRDLEPLVVRYRIALRAQGFDGLAGELDEAFDALAAFAHDLDRFCVSGAIAPEEWIGGPPVEIRPDTIQTVDQYGNRRDVIMVDRECPVQFFDVFDEWRKGMT